MLNRPEMNQKKKKDATWEQVLCEQEAFVFSCVLSFALPLFGKK